MGPSDLRRWFVRQVYANHNDSPSVRRALAALIARLPEAGRGLNVGSGRTDLDRRLVNIDIAEGPGVRVRGSGLLLPFRSQSFDLVLSQEAVEHMSDPFTALDEMARVLRSGGYLYLQVPFTIGYHPGPTDFWRFTREGITELVQRTGLQIEAVEISVGGATGAYRILVEFTACLVAAVFRPTYKIVKAAAALALFPIKWLDGVVARSGQADRVAGGYFVVARKP